MPGCTNKAASRGLCSTHYEYARYHGGFRGKAKRGPPASAKGQQNGNHNHDGYDEDFYNLFVSELELRGSPRYPDNPWFSALYRADDEYRRLGPLKPVIRAYQSPETSGVPEYNHDEDLSRTVNLACTRWLDQHGYPEPIWTPSPGGT